MTDDDLAIRRSGVLKWLPGKYVTLVAASVLIAACSSGGSDRAEVDEPPPIEPSPTEPVVTTKPPAPPPVTSGPIKAADIMKALAGKTFNYSKGSRSGVISYLSDGTFTYRETGKGEGSGVWQASDGALCEAFDPTSFLPKGTRSECLPFKAGGGGYTAGSTSLTPA